MTTKFVDKYTAGNNRVFYPYGRKINLVALEIATTHQEIMNDWSKTLTQQMDLVAQYARDKISGTAGRNWAKEPSADWVDEYFESKLSELHDYHSKVRVVELPHGEKRWVLVYGDISDSEVVSGTGPFATQEQAWMWFLNGGR